ncbi:gamma subclass chorismate mutase AroQ [bacterium]|nr:gamma subclass chorismate mutase AroQ [bacterium]
MRILVLALLLTQALWAQPAKMLLQGISRRLEISREVAWIKWKRHLPIEDGPREEALLTALPTLAGLEPERARHFMEAQIEASKELQTWLIDNWESQPSYVPGQGRELAEIRQELDRLTLDLLTQLQASHSSPDEILLWIPQIFGAHLAPWEETALRSVLP